MNRSTEQARTGGNGSRQERERAEHKGTGREREAAREREREIFWDINYLPPGPCFSAKLLISCSEWRKKTRKKAKCFCNTSEEEAEPECVSLVIPLNMPPGPLKSNLTCFWKQLRVRRVLTGTI